MESYGIKKFTCLKSKDQKKGLLNVFSESTFFDSTNFNKSIVVCHDETIISADEKRIEYCRENKKGTIEKIEGRDYEQVTYTQRFFFYFPTITEMKKWYFKLPDEKKTVYGLHFKDQLTKLYFDIDVAEDGTNKYTKEEIYSWLMGVILTTGKVLNELLVKRDRKFKMQDALVYETHRQQKWSFHVVVESCAFPGIMAVKQVVQRILSLLPEHRLNKHIDRAVYSSKQQMRLLHSHKTGVRESKMFDFTWDMNVNNPTKINTESGALIREDEFERSLITYIPGELRKHIITPPAEWPILTKSGNGKKVNNNANITYTTVSEEEQVKVIEMIQSNAEIMNSHVIGNWNDSVLTLTLNKKDKGACVLCKRVHESQNAYVTVSHTGAVHYIVVIEMRVVSSDWVV